MSDDAVTPTAPPAITFNFAVNILAPNVVAVLLDGSTEGVTVVLEAENAHDHVANVTVETRNNKPYTTALVLGGPDGGLFALDNGGVAPCNLTVGSSVVVAAAYAITITAP